MDEAAVVRRGLLAGSGLALAVVVVAIATHPRVIDDGRTAVVYLVFLFAGAVAALLAALAGTSAGGPVWAGARWDGCRWGLLFGALWIVEMLLANLGYGLGWWTKVPYFASTWLVWLLTGYAGFAAARRYRRWWAGTLVGAWSGLVSGLIGLTTMATLPLVAMPVLRHDPQNVAEFQASGNRGGSLSTAICADFLGAGINHLLIVGLLLGSVLATIGAALGTAASATATRTVPAGPGDVPPAP